MKKGVSFITVIRNVELNKLNNTINSILINCRAIDYEIILQDGSDYKSNSIFDNKVKYFYQKDEGIYNAMNLAINKASYSHLFFINVGDTLLDGINNFNSDNIQVVQYFNFVRDSENIYYPKFITKFYMIRNALCHQCQIYPTNVVVQAGGYNEKYQVLADQELSLKLYLQGVRFLKNQGFISKTAPMEFSAKNKKLRDFERKQIIQNFFKNYQFLKFIYFLTLPKLRNRLLRFRVFIILRNYIKKNNK